MSSSVPCALCEVDDAEHLLTKHGHDLVQCRRCSLVYVSPQPDPGRLAAGYNADAFHAHQRSADEGQHNRARDQTRAAMIARHQPGGRLLDVGCSTGSFLRAARARGFAVSGIDLGLANVERARAAGLDVHHAVVEQAPFTPRSFDVITLFDSIEHMPEPVAALEASRELLADDGLLVLTTPNVGGLFPRLTWQLFGRTIGAWEHPTPPWHLFQFSRQTMRRALEKAGLREVWGRTERIPLDYTVDELGDALLAAAKHRVARGRQPPANERGAAPRTAPGSSSDRATPSFTRRAIRRSVRTASWLFTGAISPLAGWLDRGDSMVVLARKR